MINVSELVTDPDFAQQITVYRKVGAFARGRWTSASTQTLTLTGVIKTHNTKDDAQNEDADMLKGAIDIITQEPLTTMQADASGATAGNYADEIPYKGILFKVFQCADYGDYGYYKSVAIRKPGG